MGEGYVARDVPAPPDCLDENAFQEFVDGVLSPEQHARVEGHVARCAPCRGLLAATVMASDVLVSAKASLDETLESLSTPRVRASAFFLTLAPGALVNRRFRIVRPLGRGAAGSIYLAEDAQLGRKVALKFIARPATAEGVRRVLVEARATASLKHPNIVTIYDVGEHQRHPYLALEYVEGTSLRARLARGPMAPAEVLRVGLALASALVAAHANGITHRDLKPENVILSDDGEPHVLDFGLASVPLALDEAGAAADRHVRGTPAYMAPEQWTAGGASAKSDVWALGVVLHELLTGERPWRASSFEAIRQAVTTTEPTPLAADVASPALARLVWDCLAKTPAQRPPIADVARRLAEAARDGVSRAKRRRLLFAVLPLVLVVILVAAGSTAARARFRETLAPASRGAATSGAPSGAPARPCRLPAPAADPRLSPATQVAAAALAATRATVRWRLAPGATSYTVRWSTHACFSDAEATAVTLVPTRKSGQFDHVDAARNTTFYYRVTANYDAGPSTPSIEVSANTTPLPMSPPQGVTGEPVEDVNHLRWSLVAGATSYAVFASPTPGIDPATSPGVYLLGETPVYVESGLFRHLGIAPGSTTYYRVVAVSNGAASPASAEIRVTR